MLFRNRETLGKLCNVVFYARIGAEHLLKPGLLDGGGNVDVYVPAVILKTLEFILEKGEVSEV